MIDHDPTQASYHRTRAAQERAAALRANDQRSHTAHLHLAVVHEAYDVFGRPGGRDNRPADRA